MAKKMLIGNDEYSLSYMDYWLKHFMKLFVEMQTGNIKENVIINGLEKIIALNEQEKVFTLISSHLSLQDINLPNYILFINGFKENLPRTFGGDNLLFPYFTKGSKYFPGLFDMKKGGMISISRMSKSNDKNFVIILKKQLEERLLELYTDGKNSRFFLTNGRPRNDIYEGKPTGFIKNIPSVCLKFGKDVYIVPEIISYERVVGDWTLSRQDLMKNPELLLDWMNTQVPGKYLSNLVSKIYKIKGIKKAVHNSAIFWDAFALLYNNFCEPKTQIHIDYLEPIKVNGNQNRKFFYKEIEKLINSNIRVSSANIVSYIIYSHYNKTDSVLKYNNLLNLIDNFVNSLKEKNIPLFDNIKNANSEEIYFRANEVLRNGRIIPGFSSISDSIYVNPKSKLLGYYASRLFPVFNNN